MRTTINLYSIYIHKSETNTSAWSLPIYPYCCHIVSLYIGMVFLHMTTYIHNGLVDLALPTGLPLISSCPTHLFCPNKKFCIKPCTVLPSRTLDPGICQVNPLLSFEKQWFPGAYKFEDCDLSFLLAYTIRSHQFILLAMSMTAIVIQ